MAILAIDIRILGKQRTGDETVFFELTREVLRQDTANHYLLLTNEQESEKLENLKKRLEITQAHHVEIVTLRARNRFRWNLFTLPLFLLRRKVSVFHTQYILPFWVPRRTKVVNHIHDVSFAAYPELISPRDRYFLEKLIPRSLRRSDRIIAPSEFTKTEIIKYYRIPEEKITVVPNAIGSNFLSHIGGKDTEEAVRRDYHLPEKFILAVGTLQPRKNIPFLLEAFALLQKRLPEYKLVLVGNRQAHHFDFRIDHLIHEKGLEKEVLFPGYVTEADLPTLIRLATVYVFPSLYEGFGIPLLEAMSQGVPTAASRIPALEEVGGDGATYFDPRDVASLEQALYNLCINSSLQRELRERGQERVSSFSWPKSAAILLNVYQSLASQGGKTL